VGFALPARSQVEGWQARAVLDCCPFALPLSRRFYKNFGRSKKKAFTKYAKKYTDGKNQIQAELEQLKKHCSVIRVLAHTQVRAWAGSGWMGGTVKGERRGECELACTPCQSMTCAATSCALHSHR
jgi:hypothetical protein